MQAFIFTLLSHEVILNAYLANGGKGLGFDNVKSQIEGSATQHLVGYSITKKCFKAAPSKEIIEAHGLSWIRHLCGPTSLFLAASLPIYLCYKGEVRCPKTVQVLVVWHIIQATLSLLGDYIFTDCEGGSPDLWDAGSAPKWLKILMCGPQGKLFNDLDFAGIILLVSFEIPLLIYQLFRSKWRQKLLNLTVLGLILTGWYLKTLGWKAGQQYWGTLPVAWTDLNTHEGQVVLGFHGERACAAGTELPEILQRTWTAQHYRTLHDTLLDPRQIMGTVDFPMLMKARLECQRSAIVSLHLWHIVWHIFCGASLGLHVYATMKYGDSETSVDAAERRPAAESQSLFDRSGTEPRVSVYPPSTHHNVMCVAV